MSYIILNVLQICENEWLVQEKIRYINYVIIHAFLGMRIK